MARPLAGVRVADFSRVLSGPWCTMTLADLGADVVKVEHPDGDETRGWGPPFVGGESTYFLSTNRGKRSMALDLRRPEHLDAARRLIDRSDVLIENFRPGTMERLGLGEDACRERNPGIVYASITGFGRGSDLPGYDVIIQGMGGVMHLTGEPEGDPQKVGIAVSDITSGLYAAVAICAALREREHNGGIGRRVDVSLLGTQVAWLANQAANHLIGGLDPTRMGNAHPNIVPYQVFHGSDGPFVLAVANERIWARFCAATGREDLATDALYLRNADRVAARTTLIADLEAMFSTRPRAVWIETLEAGGVPCGPINSLPEVFEDPRVRALDLVESIPHPTAGSIDLVRAPFADDREPSLPPPLLGEHTEELLADLGYDATEIRGMLA